MSIRSNIFTMVFVSTLLLLLSACSSDDSSKKSSVTSPQESVIYLVNGRGESLTFSITDQPDTVVANRAEATRMVTGVDRYEVSYQPDNSDSTTALFSADSVYLYAATHCSSPQGALHHEISTHKVTLVNLGDIQYRQSPTSSVIITQADKSTTHQLTETIAPCTITPTASLDSVQIENGMNILMTRNGVVDINYTVSGLDTELLALGDKLKLDIVIFDQTHLMVVPMTDYDDLVAVNAIERCNGIDDDGDGLTDEDNVCATVEVCDGLDNDLDGLTDEDGVCTEICGNGIDDDFDGLTDEDCPSDEQCDGVDNDLDGQTDEDLTQACGLQTGVCSGSIATCTGGEWPVCSETEYGSNYETDETSCDGLDNDCDGETDEGDACAEICDNGIDDDSDGETDEADCITP